LTLRVLKFGKFYTGSEDVMKEGLIMSKVEVLNESSFDELVLMIESARNRAAGCKCRVGDIVLECWEVAF
jgi:hypothetical protein